MAIVISGPAGSGKSQHAQELADFYQCKVIIDEWCKGDPIPHNALILTQADVPGAIKIKDALKKIGK